MRKSDFPASLATKYSGPRTLENERAGSGIDVQELTQHLYSQREGYLARRDEILQAIEQDPLFRKGMANLELSRVERFKLGLARTKRLRRLFDERGWDLKEDWMLACGLVDEVSPYYLHVSMFATTIQQQGNEAQKAEWLPSVHSWEVVGAYSQTELGHGSNVRGLETMARYDPQTKEFSLHSPTLTAAKWWNGALGRTATHAIVIAQLLLPTQASDKTSKDEYKSHGPQPFVVPIRDPRTQEPFPGIVVGDIGPKYGYATMDNGYMLFDHYRIPHSALLARYVHVDPNSGSFSRTGHPATVYGSLTNVRSKIVQDAGLTLARAVTIAVRYTAVRRQFHDRDDTRKTGDEVQVLDYPTVMVRVLPLLATAFALHYTAEAMSSQYGAARTRIEQGDFSPLAELHGTSSGLKSLCTTLAADGIETCRRAMGGHGFGGGSGLLGLNSDYLSKPTVEGDNWMITQQVASYLIKKMERAVTKPEGTSEEKVEQLYRTYLKSRCSRKPPGIINASSNMDDSGIVEAFQWRAADLAWKAYQARVVRKEPWTNLMIELNKLSRAYSEAMLISNFHTALTSTSVSSLKAPGPSVLRSLFRLFALFTIDSSSASFIATSALPLSTLDTLPHALLTYMRDHVRPHAVPLVDAWAIPEYVLDSALGRKDGRAYEALFEYAHYNNPMNDLVINPYYWDEEIVVRNRAGEKERRSKL